MAADLWVFGYGSIMWKADFPFEEKRIASTTGWTRRFWQGSEDHRGIPGKPGRVVTLIPSPGETCWGMAYRLKGALISDVLDALDYREKNGYKREDIELQFTDGSLTRGITYHATPDNPHFLGEASARDIAAHIAASAGPSGTNKEYILELHQALESHGISDLHVAEIVRFVELPDTESP